jgi:hypothetical protein
MVWRYQSFPSPEPPPTRRPSPSNVSVTFSQAASNNGTILGDATFNNASPFRIGTVGGTSTLAGTSQTITGFNSVLNFIKSVLSRDTLYLSSDSTLNVSGLFTLMGANANALLTVRSTVPGSQASIGVNGSAAFDFLRIKDVNNTGAAQSLVGRTAYDDGGNAGFSFRPNSSSGTRNGLTSGVSRPSTPVVRAANAAAAQARASAAPARATAGTTLALREFRKATALSLSTVSLPVNRIGRLSLAPLPSFGGTGKGSFSFESPVARFLFEPLPARLAASIASSPRLSAYLASAGVTGAQSLVRLAAGPLAIASADASGTYAVSAEDGRAIRTTLSSDGRASLFQELRVRAGEAFDVSAPEGGKASSAAFDGKAVSFGLGGSLRLTAPAAAGSYVLRSDASPIALVVRVEAPSESPREIDSPTPAPRTLWQRLKGLFGR